MDFPQVWSLTSVSFQSSIYVLTQYFSVDGDSRDVMTSGMTIMDVIELIDGKAKELEYATLLKDTENNTDLDW